MNMRKIIAVLSAVLMLCAIVPMGVFAAEGDVVASYDWNDSTLHFDVGEVVAEGPDGSNCYKWAFGGGWASNYMVVKNMDPTKDYTITMMAKGSVASSMGITIQNGDWGSYWNGPTFNVTTEWQEIVITLPANGIPFTAGSILFKFQGNGASAYDLYVDDLVISEGLPKVPLCENGDFETGDGTNWSLHQSSVVDTTAAYGGSYGAHLYGAQNWNSMMERTFDVVAGKNYELSFWAKAVSGGANIKFLDQSWQGSALADGIWFSSTTWTQKTVTFTADSNKFYLNFCGAGPDSVAEELYIDDVTLIEIKEPSYDGYLYNGDFETGKTDSWTNLYGSTAIELVDGYNSDYALKGTASGGYNITYQSVAVEPNTNYTIVAYSKDSSNSALWIKNAGGNGDLKTANFNSGSDWALTSVSFNSGSNSSIWVGLMGISAGGTYTVDNITMFESADMSDDGYLKNGTLDIGSTDNWSLIWSTQVTASIVYGGKDSSFAVYVAGQPEKQYGQFRQTVAVEPNTDYKVTVWAKNSSGMSLLVKDGADSYNINNVGASAGDEWTLITNEFNSGDNTSVLVGVMVGSIGGYGTFDGFLMEKKACEHEYTYDCSKVCSKCGEETRPEAEHSYFYPCDPVCQICYEVTNPDATHNIVAVEAVEATCTENGNIAYWYCADCGAAWSDEALTQQTNLRNVIIPAAHTYDDDCDSDCNVCEEYRDAPHNLTTHVEAVEPANCQEEGYNEHWICEDCGGYFMSNGMGGYYETNPAWMYYTGEHVRPEGAAGCAVVACELCGEDSYGTEACVRPEGVPQCQDTTCVNCGGEIYGEGCTYGYDEETWEPLSPFCQPGDCIYCGTHYDYLYEHENGSYAPCSVDGECVYGCGLQYPATGVHAVDNPCEGGLCWMCWEEIPAADHVYDNEFDADCNVCGAVREVTAPVIDVKLSISEDVNGLAFRFEADVAGFAIKVGTFVQADYTNATYNGYKLIETGVTASNGVGSATIKGERMCDLDENGKALFAYRIVNIPADKLDVEITMTPYYVIEIDGVETTVYGEDQIGSYAEVAVG